MSQSRFSIVLVGVSALLRRPLVSRLRPADGERSPWVVFTARRCLPFRRLPLGGLAFGLPFPLFGTHRFGVALGELALPPSVSGLPSPGWPSGSPLPLFGMRHFGVAARWVRSFAFRFGDSVRRVGLRVHCFRFSACTDSEWPLGEFVLPPSASEIALGGLVLPLGGWPSGSLLPLFGTHRFGVALVGLAFGSPLPLFGMHRSAPLHRRSEDRRSTPTRQLFHFKTLIPTC